MSELGDRLRGVAKAVDEAGNITGIIVLMTGPVQYELGTSENIDFKKIATGLIYLLNNNIYKEIMTDIVENNSANVFECISSKLN